MTRFALAPLVAAAALAASVAQAAPATYTIEPTALSGIDDWVRQRQAAMNQAFDRLVQAMKDFPEEGVND